jgi:hypothetical protein
MRFAHYQPQSEKHHPKCDQPSRLVVSTGTGATVGKYRLINGVMIRLPLTDANLTQRRVSFSEELRDALWPDFFEIQKHNDRAPVHLKFPGENRLSGHWNILALGFGGKRLT